MAAGLALNDADVQTPTTTHKGVGILVRRNVAKLTRGREVVAEVPDVATVRPTGKRTWSVTFTDGTAWQVEMVPCAPCTGRRRT